MKLKRILMGLGLSMALLIAGSAIAFAVTTAKITKDKVYLRQGPSTKATVLSTLDKNTVVTVEAAEGEWLKVSVGEKSGYVRSDMLKIQDEQPKTAENQEGVARTEQQMKTEISVEGSQAAAPDDQAAFPKTVFIAKDLVNMRQEPNTKAQQIKQLKLGDEVLVLNVVDDWYQIEHEGLQGYIFSELCCDTKPDPLQATNSSQSSGSSSSAKSGSVLEAQEHLKKLGFYTRDLDGGMGHASISAIKSFQYAYNLDVDGKLNEKTMEKLREAAASGGNGSSAGQVAVSENGVILSEWFNSMKYSFPKYEHLRCVDVDTGVEFKLRAFSLGNHADVETPTKQDTQILYKINGNQWTWTPRAIWVYIDDKVYAAAINVKPHGPDTISDNGMDGQICMHFLYSRQHNTGQENNNLQQAIHKAFALAEKAPAPNEPANTLAEATNTDAGSLSSLSYDEMLSMIAEEE